jgi:hypothetical protein
MNNNISVALATADLNKLNNLKGDLSMILVRRRYATHIHCFSVNPGLKRPGYNIQGTLLVQKTMLHQLKTPALAALRCPLTQIIFSKIPIQQLFNKSLDVVRPPVLVIEIIGVFPNINDN